MTLRWYGDRVQARLLEAIRQGIDETMAECVNKAKPKTPVLTGTLQGSIQFRPAEVKGDSVSGVWGSFDVNYAIYVETGSLGRPARNMLRSSAAEEYPRLIERIRRRYERTT